MDGGAGNPVSQLGLPPGFRFFPTDEELLVHYLCRKVSGQPFSLPIIGDVDLYKCDPWVLPGKAAFGEKEWYFFSPRDRKYPNGTRPNRVAGSGYWKATGTDKVISVGGKRVGIKKALVFYVGKAPRGSKTNWIMHEYRLCDTPSPKDVNKRKTITTLRLDDWVLCRIYRKSSSVGQQQKESTTVVDAPGSSCKSTSYLQQSLPLGTHNVVNRTANPEHPTSYSYTVGDGRRFGSDGQAARQQQDPMVCRMDSPSDVLGSSASIEEEVDSAILRSGHLAHLYSQQREQGNGEVGEGIHHPHNAVFSRLLQSIAGGFDESFGYRQ